MLSLAFPDIHQEVLHLDVTMDEVPLVGVVDRLHHAFEELLGEVLLERIRVVEYEIPHIIAHEVHY